MLRCILRKDIVAIHGRTWYYLSIFNVNLHSAGKCETLMGGVSNTFLIFWSRFFYLFYSMLFVRPTLRSRQQSIIDLILFQLNRVLYMYSVFFQYLILGTTSCYVVPFDSLLPPHPKLLLINKLVLIENVY